jgi:hypothetical protein
MEPWAAVHRDAGALATSAAAARRSTATTGCVAATGARYAGRPRSSGARGAPAAGRAVRTLGVGRGAAAPDGKG